MLVGLRLLKPGAVIKQMKSSKFQPVVNSSRSFISMTTIQSELLALPTSLNNGMTVTLKLNELMNFRFSSRKFSTTDYKMKYGGNKMLHDSFDSPETEELQKLLDNNLAWDTVAHQVLVIQPYVKWGPDKKTNTNADLMLEEAVALVKSLSKWKVVGKKRIGLQRMSKDTIFGAGNIDALARHVSSNSSITAVFISVAKLTNEQYYFLSNLFKVPVFDRYSLVIQIFKEHAKSPESKLQVSLAELPYIVGRYLSPHYDKTKKILMKYQKKLETSMQKLKKHREVTRKNRHNHEFPIVAVVGYTNAGKTSLIKALTHEENLTPENFLFATLDVTMHEGSLPCNLKVLYADTIGFIADLPTELMEPFKATLEDAMLADVILHVIDVSHPNHPAQYDEVICTLDKLNLRPELKKNMINLGNKMDLVPHEKSLEIPSNFLLVSATKGLGLNQLLSQLETIILSSTDRRKLTVRVKIGGEEELWLKKEAAVMSSDVDPKNPLYLLLKVVITQSKLEMFKHRYIDS